LSEINQIIFKHQEVIEALIKQANLHEGKWQLIMTFGLAAMNMGPTHDEVSPGATVAVTGIGIKKAESDSPPALVLDAAQVNPS
jgi:hypothetical protein